MPKPEAHRILRVSLFSDTQRPIEVARGRKAWNLLSSEQAIAAKEEAGAELLPEPA